MSKKFKQLLVPEGYRHYWSKYPEGYTILEALLNWVDSVNQLTENVNDWNIYLDDFVENFDQQLIPTVETMLDEMAVDGTLEQIINHNIFNDLNTQLAQTVKKGDLFSSVKEYGAIGDGQTLDKTSFVSALENEVVYLPKGTYNLNSELVSTGQAKIIRGDNAKIIGGFIPNLDGVKIHGVEFVGEDIENAPISIRIIDKNNIIIDDCIFNKTRIYAETTTEGVYKKGFTLINSKFVGDVSLAPSHRYPVLIRGIEDIKITGNTFDMLGVHHYLSFTSMSNKSYELHLDESDNLVRNVVITNNIFKGSIKTGSVVDMYTSGVKVLFNNNVVYTENGEAIFAFKRDGSEGHRTRKNREIIISNNTIDTSANYVFRIWGGYDGTAVPLDQEQTVILSDNTINHNGTGNSIHLRGMEKAHITNNIINNDNEAYPIRIGTDHGSGLVLIDGNTLHKGSIATANTRHLTITNNNILDFGDSFGGVFISSSGDYANISNNFIKTTATSFSQSLPAAIRAFASTFHYKWLVAIGNTLDADPAVNGFVSTGNGVDTLTESLNSWNASE